MKSASNPQARALTYDLGMAFKDCMAAVCAPLSIVTACHNGSAHGTTVSAFASLSLDPPMVLVSLSNDSSLLPIIEKSGRFGLNILAADQALLGTQFARKVADRFEGVDWDIKAGVPRLDGVTAWLACEVSNVVAGGDHQILLGTVERAEHLDAAPLVYYKRRFGTYADLP